VTVAKVQDQHDERHRVKASRVRRNAVGGHERREPDFPSLRLVKKICLRLELHLTVSLDKSGANEFHIS
jgi:hypothetical protein